MITVKMNICSIIIVFVSAVLYFQTRVVGASGCKLSYKKDFGYPPPVYIQDNTYLEPDGNGAVSVTRSGTVTVSCPGNGNFVVLANASTKYETLEAHCINNSTFRVDRWIGQFRDIRCSSQPTYRVDSTKTKCYDGSGVIYRVGYSVGSQFHELYSSCYDMSLVRAHYVKHRISPSSVYLQSGHRRPSFSEAGLFGNLQLSKLYSVKHQTDRLNQILGKGMAQKYVSKYDFLNRGHLAPRGDFPMLAQLRASFLYINSAPQWMRPNAGDWAALEEALRRRVNAIGYRLTVFTGTFGVMTLPDSAGRMQEIYLHTDDNNNDVLPVPMYYYKLVYDPKKKAATAFITINSSFYDSSKTEELSFCSDICEGNDIFNWLRWRSKDGAHSFCCEYDDFIQTVKGLGPLDVRGVFY